MNHVHGLLPLMVMLGCNQAGPGRLPGTPMAYTELASGEVIPEGDTGSCEAPTVERFASLNDAAPYLAEHLPDVAPGLPHTQDDEQLVVAMLSFCSSGGPELVVDDVRDVDGATTAFLAVLRPDTAIDQSRRPYVIFTIPASVTELEVVVDRRSI